MADIIDYGKLFNFGDSTPIDKAIADIERLTVTLEQLQKTSDQAASDYSHALKDIAASAGKLDTEVDNLDVTLEEHQKLIIESANQAEKLIRIQEQTAKAMSEEQKAAELLKITNEALAAAKAKLGEETLKEAGSIAALRDELKKAVKDAENMGDATDEVVKKEALDRVQELSKNLQGAEAALKTAKKGVDVAAGSYNHLQQEVAHAKAQLKAMEGGIGSTSDEFKALQKTVKDGTDKLKAFDEGIGDNKRSVGDYGIAVDKLDQASGGAVSSIKAVGNALKVAFTTGPGLIILALASAIGALKAYFEGSIEGQDRFNKVLAVGNAILETLMDVVEEVGKVIFEAFTEPQKTLKAFLDLISPITEGIKGIFDDPIGSIKAFGQAILDNVVNRFKAVGVAIEAVQKIASGQFAEGFKQLGNAAIQGATGVENAIDKIAAAATAAYDAMSEAARKAQAELEARIALGQKIADLENQIRKEKIADILDDAQTELKVFKLLNDAQDKLKFSAEERFKFQRQAGALLQEQLAGDLELINKEIAAQKLRIQQNGETYESLQALVELEAQAVGLQSEFEKARKKRQATEIALIREIEKETLDQINREKDAQRQLNEAILKGHTEANKQMIADDRTTFADREALINDNAEIALDLAEQNLQKELDVAKNAALERVSLSSEALEAIYNNEAISINERIAQERAAKEQLIGTDQAYIDTVTRLNEQFKNETIRINDETVQATADNVFKQWANDFDDLVNKVDTSTATQALGLQEALAAGKISYSDYQDTLEQLQVEGQAKQLKAQLDYLKKQEEALRNAGYNTTALAKQIADTELAIATNKNAKLIEGEALKEQKLKELKQVAISTALTVIDSANEAEDIRRQERLTKLEENYNNELLLAGDNQAAKAELDNQYKVEKDKIDKEQRAADRKRAVFQKTMAVVEIAINTAKGIGMALGTYPPPVSFVLAAIVGAIGALQVAAVLSKPIPAFAEGTDSAPGGLSLVGEDGPEAVRDSKGTRIYSKPSLVDLERGARVYTAEETAEMRRAQAQADGMISGFDDDAQKMKFIKVEVDNRAMTNVLAGKLDKIDERLAKQKPVNLNPKGLAREIATGFDMSVFLANEYK